MTMTAESRLKNGPSRKKEQRMLVVTPLVQQQPGTKWYEYENVERTVKPSTSLEQIRKVEEVAELLLREDGELQRQMQSKKSVSEAAWLNTVLAHGTAVDKVTAMQILIQRFPVHSLSHIAALVTILAKKNTREAFSLLSLLKDLFINELLPPKRKLISFSSRPVDEINLLLLDKDRSLKKKLVLWKFESDLKALYEKFVAAVERLAGGNVEKLCSLACRNALELLLERPELEQKLLSLLVNKLGNPNRMLATRVCGYLLQLTRKQPLMRFVVVKEVERLLYRKNIACSAQLHAISFLSQMDLTGCDPTLASSMLNIYVGLFRILVLHKKMDDKMLSALLLATNRVFPHARSEAGKLIKEVDTLYKILHHSNFATALQTLKLLYQLLTTSEGVSDRFYAALYRRLLDSQHSANLDKQLFALLFRALSSDIVERRVVAFIKRLLQLSLCRSASFAVASLLLISRLAEERASLLITEKVVDRSSSAKFIDSSKREDEELYVDYDSPMEIPEISAASHENDENVIKNSKCVQKNAAGWVHKNNIVVRGASTSYDPLTRNPLFSRADKSFASELILLSAHYHPSVAVFASNLLKGIPIRYDGNPLIDFTQMRFLDRFVFRNPKVKKLSSGNVLRRKMYDPQGVRKLSVTSEEYIAKSRNEIPSDERFIHRFALAKMKMKKENEGGDALVEDDIESINSDEFDMLLSRFEPDERREVCDIDFSQEFNVERRNRGNKIRKRLVNFDTGLEEDDKVDEDAVGLDEDEEPEDRVDFDEDEESENWSEDEFENDDVEEGSSEEEYVMRKKKDDGTSSSEDDFAEKLGFLEDAERSADNLAAVLEEKGESGKKAKKKRRPCDCKKRRRH